MAGKPDPTCCQKFQGWYRLVAMSKQLDIKSVKFKAPEVHSVFMVCLSDVSVSRRRETAVIPLTAVENHGEAAGLKSTPVCHVGLGRKGTF